MKEIFELTIWTYPGLLLSEVNPDLVSDPLRSTFDIEPLELMDQSPSPDDVDVENLAISIKNGEITTDEFLKFCLLNKLNPNINDPTSALSFLGYSYGYEIAWLNVPHTAQGLIKLNRIAELVRNYRAIVVDSHRLYCYRPTKAESSPVGW